MLKNYLKIALRTLVRHRTYSFINVFGLALSMSVCLLILLLVRDQLSYDGFHEKADRIYRVIAEQEDGHGVGASPAFLGPAIERDVPGVEQTVRFGQIRTNAIHVDKSLRVVGLYAEPSFFEVFDFPLTMGDSKQALTQPHSVILSEATAEKIFGDADPMGRILTLEGVGDVTVTGVVRTEPMKSHLKFDVLASFSTLEALDWGRESLADENNFWSFATYVLLAEGAGTDRLRQYVDQVSRRYAEGDALASRLKLQPLTAITLGPDMSNEISSYSLPLVIVLLLGGIGLVIMLAAGFNYIGLTVARAMQRAKEVGIRKTVGAHRGQVILQFLAESVLVALAALVLSYVLLAWLVPGFNRLSVAQEFRIALTPAAVYDPVLVGLFLAFSVAVGLLAGLYPAVHLSRFRPALVLKSGGASRSASRLPVRKVLVVLQLVFSLVFIVTAALIYRQFQYMIHFDFGFRTADLINLELQGADYTLIRDELLRHPGVWDVAAVSEPPASGSTRGLDLTTEGRDTLGFIGYSVDSRFLTSLDLSLVAGSNFSPARSGRMEGVILNETAVRRLGFASPEAAVGQVVSSSQFPEPQPVLGVVEDYQFNHLLRPVEAMLLYHDPEQFEHLFIRVQPGTAREVSTHLEGLWKRIDPVHPIAYTFYDAQLRHDNEGMRAFRDFLQVLGLSALIALTIACLGLLSMAAYSAQVRTKEIGIRKVLGATVSHVVWLLSREFLVLLGIAVTIAVPLAWFANNLWLELIANRVSFGPLLLVVSTALLFVLAALAIGTQTVRAALANPVDSLRYE